ncbi:MAG: 50S ribosomal protein L18 [Calditrichaeota bacterium]|nr:50S ribosomal protein L18 [Calditrichota bacterium]RQV92364.1 MAG: 50S ribosomal protein L18 [bacterium]RQV98708.1 MAG: 50S ribosomal protein L18 [Calditrichota bacterium]
MSERKRRKKRIVGSSDRPRLVVFRSLNNFYGQIVDDSARKTLLGASSLTKDIRDEVAKSKSRQEASKIVGKYIAEKAKKKKIKRVIFDRNGYAYHGRVKAFAEGAREGGLEF